MVTTTYYRQGLIILAGEKQVSIDGYVKI